MRQDSLSYGDTFVLISVKQAELTSNAVFECIESENSRCILVNIDSYS